MVSRYTKDRWSKWMFLRRRAVTYLLDWFACAVSGYLAFQLRFDGRVPAQYLQVMGSVIGIWTVTQAIAFVLARQDRGNWRFTSAYDAACLVGGMTGAAVAGGALIAGAFGWAAVPRAVFPLDWLLACMATLGMRLAVRVYLTSSHSAHLHQEMPRTLIYGAGTAGLALLWELRQNQSLQYQVVGFVDDDPSKSRLVLQGKPVLGDGLALAAIVRKQNIKKVLIAIPSATGAQMVRILEQVIKTGVEYRTVPGMAELIRGAKLDKQIRPVAVDDLLGRQPVTLDQKGIRAQIEGKTMMVTGAAGSIGSELCRQIAYFRPAALVGFDVAETPLFHLEREMKKNFPQLTFHPEIGSVTRRDDLQRVMKRHVPSMVLHAAAYKHVPMMERHVFAAVENNIFGTWNVAKTAAWCGVEDFVMISTDKAVRPTSMMGATKRIAELMIRALQKKDATRFVAVRFGNVLGSNGSVVPIFKEQIAAGGPVTVTHPEITRYFMTIPEAAQLVLQASSFRKAGEVFLLDMGKPIKIVDLAKDLIMLSGLRPGEDIPIQFTGLRPGEKLYEELNFGDEHMVSTSHAKINCYLSDADFDADAVCASLLELREIADTRDTARLVSYMKRMIPDYHVSEELLVVAQAEADKRRREEFKMPRVSRSIPTPVPQVPLGG